MAWCSAFRKGTTATLRRDQSAPLREFANPTNGARAPSPIASGAQWHFGSISIAGKTPPGINTVQRKCEACQEEDETISRKPAGNAKDVAHPSMVEDVVHSPGQSLDTATRADFESRFGHDFSAVRVHADNPAAESAKAINAFAYTVGNHIAFAAGQYQPSTSAGRRLLAHELTHVLQQGGAPVSIQRYHHDSSCSQSDLEDIIWPGDGRMRQMVAKAIRVLNASPIDPTVTALFPKYFMTATPPIGTILEVFNAVQSEIDGNDYTYECETECGSDAAYVRDRLRYIGIDPNVHVCTDAMSGYGTRCIGSLFFHEMTHYAAHLDDEDECGSSCTTTGCPASLSSDDALDNSYSYANFVYQLDPMPV